MTKMKNHFFTEINKHSKAMNSKTMQNLRNKNYCQTRKEQKKHLKCTSKLSDMSQKIFDVVIWRSMKL